jgi:protoheme IX farnesyltransferase
LAYYFNNLSALIGALSLLTYAFIYTPLKRISNIAVFVGAIPGALPPMIGWVAYTGSIGLEAFVLFSIQFLWQFPHFWAIAWVSHDDYQKAGFQLLPTNGGRTRISAFYAMVYVLFLLPVSLFPYFLGMTGWVSALVIGLTGLVFLIQSIQLYLAVSNKAAVRLMLGSFVYLPVVLLALIMDKV